MRLRTPATITSKPELRQYGIGLLTRWLHDLDRNQIRLHFPRRSGLMQVIPDMHFHLWPEIFLQVSGATNFHFPEETCRVGAGEICLVSRGLPHCEFVESGPFFNIVIACTPDLTHFHLAKASNQGKPSIVVSLDLQTDDSTLLGDLLKHASDWMRRGDQAHWFGVKGSLLAHLSLVLTALKEEPTNIHEPLKVIQIRQLIMENLSMAKLSVDWLGKTLQSNPDYLSRLFRESMNRPLVGYITERKVMRAKDLLISSTLNISEISQACGYDDSSYFTRVFRKETGIAPRQYRDRALKQAEARELSRVA